MKLLVAGKSSRSYFRAGAHDVIRRTWGQEFRGLADVRFFVGKTEDNRDHLNLRSDETMLGCSDDFMSRTWKVKDICQWAVGKVYSHILLVDTDSRISPKAVLASGFQLFDYQGVFNRSLDGGTFDYHDVDPRGIGHHYQQCYPWADGNIGYTLSRHAFMTVAEKYPNQNEWAEDMWVGQILGRRASLGELTINHA